MDLQKCIQERRSVRSYKPDQVPKEIIEQVLQAGVWAPTGVGREPCRFIIIEDKELIKYVAEETKALLRTIMPPDMAKEFETSRDNICYEAPMLVLICTEKDPRWEHVNTLDSVLAAENIFLKAYELGLGTCYMGYVAFLKSKPEVLNKIGIPENYVLQAPFIIGYPKAGFAKGKRSNPKIIKWIK